jgi:hypothetical protein
MITCTVCGEANEELAIVCTKCHSYLQAKVDTIDLFPAIWGLIERPASTFRKIVLAKHKNYVFSLLMLVGVAMCLAASSYLQLGRRFPFGAVIGVAVCGGPLVGILFGLVATVVAKFVGRLLGGKGNARNLRAVLAYGAVPVIFLLVIVFPVEFGIFGKYLFDQNPPPSVLEPTIYTVLFVLNCLGLAWSVLLYGTGCAIAGSTPWWKGMVPAALVAALVVGGAVIVRGL